MNREIKFKYFFQHEETKAIISRIYTLEQIEDKNFMYHITFGLCDHKVIDKVLFSGIKDKNGVEVFEGDICRCKYYKHHEKDLYLIQKVVFGHASFFVVVGELTPNLETETYSNCPLNWVNEIEVIGDIHTTTELIK